MLRKFIILIVVSLPIALIASPQFIYCQTNSPDYIYLGDPMSKAIAACGNPISQTEETIHPTQDQAIVRWIYNYQPNSGFNQGQLVQKKKALVIDFIDQKVSAISVLNASTQTTNYCNPTVSIDIGDSMQKVGQVCFTPDLIQNITHKIVLPPKEQVTLTIQPAAGLPVQKLYFVDDKLTKIED